MEQPLERKIKMLIRKHFQGMGKGLQNLYSSVRFRPAPPFQLSESSTIRVFHWEIPNSPVATISLTCFQQLATAVGSPLDQILTGGGAL